MVEPRSAKGIQMMNLIKPSNGKLSTTLTISAVVLLSIFTHSKAFGETSCHEVFTQNWAVTARVEKNSFVTGRNLLAYKQHFQKDFFSQLQALRSDQHWVDLGAGKANAQVDYLKTFTNPRLAAKTTAVAYKIDRWFSPAKFNGKLEIREGAFESQQTEQWQKADLITDLFGVISYSRDLHTSLQKIFDLMNVNAELYVFGIHYTTSFTGKNQVLGLFEFLQTIEGLKVEGRLGVIKVVKTKESIKVPNLTLNRLTDEAPPGRSFSIDD